VLHQGERSDLASWSTGIATFCKVIENVVHLANSYSYDLPRADPLLIYFCMWFLFFTFESAHHFSVSFEIGSFSVMHLASIGQ
jgi:hypothetical protein